MNGLSSRSANYSPYPGAKSKQHAKPEARTHVANRNGYAPSCEGDRELLTHIAASSSVAYYPHRPGRQASTWAPQRAGKAVRVLSTPSALPTHRVSVPRPMHWKTATTGPSNASEIQQRAPAKATNDLVNWLQYLELHGEHAGIRELTDDQDRLLDLLRVHKPSTARRHLLMAERLRKFVEGLTPSESAVHSRIFNPKLIYEWLLALKSKDCGAHTLHSALAMVKWSSVQFIMPQDVTSSMPLYNC
eukprot:6460203-Amphidinium_carterae.1